MNNLHDGASRGRSGSAIEYRLGINIKNEELKLKIQLEIRNLFGGKCAGGR